MRRRRWLILGLLLVVTTMAGCGGGDGDDGGIATAGGNPSAGAGGKTGAGGGPSGPADDEALEFSRCVRANGVPDFPDPRIDENGGHSLNLPEGLDRAKVEAAQEKCRQHLPNGGAPPKIDPQALERMREYARCVRANGVPKFPDPVDGGIQLDLRELGLTGPDDPRLKAAEEVCQGHLPAPPPGAAPPGTNTGG